MIKTGQNAKRIMDLLRDGKNVSVFGIGENARRAVFCMLPRAVLVEPNFAAAREAYEMVRTLRPDTVFLPPRSDSIGLYNRRIGDADYERFSAISAISEGASMVVTCIEAALQLYPLAVDVCARTVKLAVGSSADPSEISKRLAAAGYRRVAQIAEKGEYSVRGDIIDVSTPDTDFRVCIDFDVIGAIKLLDENQLAGKKIDCAVALPMGEMFTDDPRGIIELVSEAARKLPRDAAERFSGKLAELSAQLLGGYLDLPFVMPFTRSCSFGTFVGDRVAVIADATTCYNSAERTYTEHMSRVTQLTSSGDALPMCAAQAIPPSAVFTLPTLTFHTGMSSNRFTHTDVVEELSDELIPDFSRDLPSLVHYVQRKTDYEVRIFCGSRALADNVEKLLAESGATAIVTDSSLSGSFALPDSRQAFIGTPSVAAKTDRSVGARRRMMPVPEVGDYVVHNYHGIGKCLAVEKLNLTGAERDYVVIGYADGGKLMLPVENLDSLSRYSYDGTVPTLSRLGGGQFARLREKVKASIRKMAIDLTELYKKRESGKGHVYAPEPAFMDEFISAFEYVDTPDQTECAREALNDLALGKIMDRLLCGDVGFGKTEVAMRVAYRVIIERKQVAFLCPTTILAFQHYQTVKARMGPFGVRCGMLSRMTEPSEARRTAEALERGEIDIVVGTHKLLGKGIKFRDLGLLVLDEEQRFGVSHKEQLKTLRTDVNVLTMTATPIPRTLHMSLSGIRDISMLATPPRSRLPVQTFVAEYSDGLLLDALMREHARGGQSFVVYNRVESIDSFAAKVSQLTSGRLSVGVVHGQMESAFAEHIIEKFVSGETDVLVATTIIENGIDIPRANSMVVIDADRLGLGQMYQLRGRIGRSDVQACAYFTYDRANRLSETAVKRLGAIMQCRELGSGFMLASRDLELRGAGNVLGREQHGHMEQVGYETYMKLLGEVMSEMHGGAADSMREVRVRTDSDAYIPAEYIGDEEWRLRQYSRISVINSYGTLRKVQSELTDMYGAPPVCVTNLLTVALVKNIATRLGASEVSLFKREGVITFDKARSIPTDFMDTASRAGAKLEITDKARVLLSGGKAMVKLLLSINETAATRG